MTTGLALLLLFGILIGHRDYRMPAIVLLVLLVGMGVVFAKKPTIPRKGSRSSLRRTISAMSVFSFGGRRFTCGKTISGWGSVPLILTTAFPPTGQSWCRPVPAGAQ